MASSPRVSIGLPVYNGEPYLEEAICSVLAQTYPDFELVISDNASTDSTPDLCQSYAARDSRVRYLRNPQNLGAARNYNQVFQQSSGDYFKWAAHDDVIAPDFLEKCVSILDRSQEVILTFSKAGRINEVSQVSGAYEYPLRVNDPHASTRFRDLILVDHNCVWIFGLIRREILGRTPLIGAYVGSDRVLLAELGLRGRFHELPETLFYRRNHPQASVRKYSEYDRSAWFDPKKSGKITFPYWRVGWEYLRCIPRSGVGAKDAIFSFFLVAWWFKNYRKRLVKDLRMATHRFLPQSK